jgi:hypothetical protein
VESSKDRVLLGSPFQFRPLDVVESVRGEFNHTLLASVYNFFSTLANSDRSVKYPIAVTDSELSITYSDSIEPGAF